MAQHKTDETTVQAKIEYLFPLPICHIVLPEDVIVQLDMITTELLHAPEEDKDDHSGQLAGKIHEGQQIAIPRKGYFKKFVETGILEACKGYIKGSALLDGRAINMWKNFDLTFQKGWIVSQYAGDYNPVHTHSGTLSGIIYLRVPPQIKKESEPDGWLTFHNNREYDAMSLRFGMTQNKLPEIGHMYLFPAWLGHSVMPFRGEGERRCISFNVKAFPTGGNSGD